MDENYRNRHRAAWERRRAAEAAEREAAAAATAASPSTPTDTQPSGTLCASSPASAPAQQQQQQQQQTASSPSAPCVSSSPSLPHPSRESPRGAPEVPSTQADAEALSEAAARRLQAEFDAIDEVRQPDAAYQECLLGVPVAGPWGPDDSWGPHVGPSVGAPNSEGFGFAGGLRAAAEIAQGLLQGSPGGPPSEPQSDAELARRLQEEEHRRARRLRQELPSLRSSEGAPGDPQRSPQESTLIPVEQDPLGLEETPCEATQRAPGPPSYGGPRAASPDVVEIPPPHQPAPDVAAAAASAGIQVDAEEAVLQAAIAQSLVDM